MSGCLSPYSVNKTEKSTKNISYVMVLSRIDGAVRAHIKKNYFTITTVKRRKYRCKSETEKVFERSGPILGTVHFFASFGIGAIYSGGVLSDGGCNVKEVSVMDLGETRNGNTEEHVDFVFQGNINVDGKASQLRGRGSKNRILIIGAFQQQVVELGVVGIVRVNGIMHPLFVECRARIGDGQKEECTLYSKQPGNLSFLKTSSAAENLVFQPTAGYRPQHANDHRDPRRLGPRNCSEPCNVTAGKHRSPPTSGGPEAGKTTAVASSARMRVLGLPFPPVATLEGFVRANRLEPGCGIS